VQYKLEDQHTNISHKLNQREILISEQNIELIELVTELGEQKKINEYLNAKIFKIQTLSKNLEDKCRKLRNVKYIILYRKISLQKSEQEHSIEPGIVRKVLPDETFLVRESYYGRDIKTSKRKTGEAR